MTASWVWGALGGGLALLPAIAIYRACARGDGVITDNIPIVPIHATPATTLGARIEKKYKALVIGASGGTGGNLVNELMRSPRVESVTVIVRRKGASTPDPAPGPNTPKFVEVVVDFSQLDSIKETFEAHRGEVMFSCFGTTMAVAQTQGRYKEMDYGYNVRAAELAKAAGVRHFLIVTAMGADPHGWFFYTALKGKLEQKIQSLGFQRFSIFRPAMIITPRTDRGQPEMFLQACLPKLDPIMGSYRSVNARVIAQAMLQAAEHTSNSGAVTEMYTSDQIHDVAALGEDDIAAGGSPNGAYGTFQG